ncbi:GTPase-GDP dissociation stimulator vimar [Drosophila sulfurigaster albostrigata]|uniref:GTPase-GDP dissociation stimulator vimar n=1 Tax=Drosophila sulfurigaster albostrigata TaxID=89887 RepID=UPI002D21B71D|nr:GTPase-GDP dissociation stimulator vimar [Drosophila sulfurigaster albostrigata]
MATEMDELIEQLKTTSVSQGDATTTLLCEISATKDPKLFDKHELAECFLRLTQSEDTNVRKEAAKCIAEITKSEVQRKKFTKREIIAAFLECLRHVPTEDGSMELPIQICRALGNICYLNDEARDLILDLQGDAVLLQLLDIATIEDAANAPQFIKVRGGLLSNYLLGGEGLAKRAMELGIMQKLQTMIDNGASNVEQHEDLLLNTLPLLSILTENVADLNFEAQLNIQLSRILAASTNPDLAEMCLELLHYQAESDEVKLLLAKDGLCETIYNLLEKYKTLASTSEARALMKLACELIVLVLTGDESMHYLYTTPLLKNMVDWLDSTDIDLLTTGVLALGNFARTDSHCIYFVEQQTMNKLLQVLAKNNGVKDDVRLQHALLSALRNLVIPKPNKNAVIQAGLVQTILPMLEIHQPPVVFKLLGTLRMTVDGQEKLALELLKNKTLIEQLVHWSKSSDYAGVTGESLRLMAWLIKHAYLNKIAYALPRKGDAPAEQIADKIPLSQDYDRSSLNEFLANEGTVEAMVSMLTAQHLVMQNEALIALCILSVVYLSKSGEPEQAQRLQDQLIECNVGAKLAELITKSSDSMTKEIVENLQNCINLLKTAEKLVPHLEQHNINELLKSIPILTEYCTL